MDKDQAIKAIETAHTAREQAELNIRAAVIDARAAGASWAAIAAPLGITKQRAQQKYADAVTPERMAYRAKLATMDVDQLRAELRASREAAAGIRARREAREAAEITAEDVAGPSVTPSIFLDPIAPATPGASVNTQGITVFKPTTRQHAAILPRGSKPITTHALPGGGKGPHLCTGCGCNNHHGSKRGIIEWNDGCKPTKYDTPAEADYLNGLTK